MSAKSQISVFALLIAGVAATHGSIAIDFTDFNFTAEVGPDNTGGVVGSQYRANDVVSLGVNSYDALFEFTGASVDSGSTIFFQNTAARGDDARLILNKTGSADIWARIDITFVDADTTTLVNLATLIGDDLRIQFDDLDSNVGNSRADFAGMLTSQFSSFQLDPDTDLITRTDLPVGVPGYTVGVLPDDGVGLPYDSYGPVVGTDPIAQSPVTIGFDTASSTISIVLGVTGTGTGNRLIDIDMTPDFVIVPEVSSYSLLVGVAALALISLRRRR